MEPYHVDHYINWKVPRKVLLEKKRINVERKLINTVPQMEPNKITIYSRTLAYSVISTK